MQEKNLYEYATIRLVPKVEREEFVNIGILLFCKSQKKLSIKWHLDDHRIGCTFPNIDLTIIQKQLESFESIAMGIFHRSAISDLDVASRFRWLTAARSSIIQTSRIHPGFTEDLDQTLQKLFDELVTNTSFDITC